MHSLRFHRIIPPAAAPIHLRDILGAFKGIFSRDKYIKNIRRETGEYFGVKHVFTVSSGKASLTLMLLALKSLSKKREVLIPAYTCFSVPSAIKKAGLEISLCDISSSNLDFDYRLLEKTINSNTLCVISTHLFGIPSEVHKLRGICESRGIYVVEDAAQAMGGSYKGQKLGTLGDVSFFSLGRGKNITCGSGGIIITNSDTIAKAIEKQYVDLKDPNILETIIEFFQAIVISVFMHPILYCIPAGMPFLKLGQTLFYKDFPVKKLSEMKAGLLQYWQDRLEESNRIRSQTADYFIKRLRLESTKTLIPYLRVPVIMDSQEKRDKIYSVSEKLGLGLSIMYPTPINEIKEIKVNFNDKTFPSARDIVNRLLTIPTHHFVSENDKEAICDLFK